MIELDGLALDSHTAGTGDLAIADGFEWPVEAPEFEYAERRIGAVPVYGPKIPNFEFEIPMRIHGESEDDVLVNYGLVAQKCTKVRANAHTGGLEITSQPGNATYATTLKCVAASVTKPLMDHKHHHHYVADFTLKLVCLPYFLGPEYTAATGTKPAGIPAADISIADARGDVPGPARIVVTNQGTLAQQFALMGAQWRDAVTGNDMLLPASTFDVSTSPLNGTYTAGTNEVQTLTKTGTISGGTWSLSWEGYTFSASFAHNASVASVQAAIDAQVGAGNITVGGTTLDAGNMTFTFVGDFAARNVAALTFSGASLTGGGSVAHSTSTPGVEGYVSTNVYSEWSSFVRTAAQTDVGSYDLWARVYDAGSVANDVLVRAVISIGDTAVGTTNRSVSIPVTGAPIWVNLGPVHATPQGVGTHKWTATIQAKTLGTEGTAMRVIDVLKVPTEIGHALVRVPPSSSATLVARDTFAAVSGALTGDTATSGQTWASMGGVSDADDFQDAATGVSRSSSGDTATDMRYGRGVVLGSTNYSRVKVGVQHSLATLSGTVRQGVIARFVNNDNFVALTWLHGGVGGQGSLALRTAIGGSVVLQASVYVGISDTMLHTTELMTDEYGAWYAFFDGTLVMSGLLTALATGGALETGKPGILDHSTSNSSERNYRNFSVYIPTPTEAAIHPSRKLQWSDDGGLHREASGGTYYSYAQGQQGVGVPLLGPEGAENLVNRLVIASADQNPDYAATGNQLPRLDYAVYHRPAYLIGRHTV